MRKDGLLSDIRGDLLLMAIESERVYQKMLNKEYVELGAIKEYAERLAVNIESLKDKSELWHLAEVRPYKPKSLEAFRETDC